MEIFKQRQLLHPSLETEGNSIFKIMMLALDDDGDEGHELEELDLGCFISPGSLFQLEASHHFLLDLADMSSSHGTDLRPGRQRLEQLDIYCLLPFLSLVSLSLRTYIVPSSLPTRWPYF